jgi:hypothetical protein
MMYCGPLTQIFHLISCLRSAKTSLIPVSDRLGAQPPDSRLSAAQQTEWVYLEKGFACHYKVAGSPVLFQRLHYTNNLSVSHSVS